MARIPIRTYICNNDSAASYDAGDEIIVYHNNTTDVIEVDVNGVTQSSGGPIYRFELRPRILLDTDLVFLDDEIVLTNEAKYSLTLTRYSFCSGNNLVTFNGREDFPYAQRVETFSESCSVVVCDLTKTGLEVTRTTTETSNDGVIAVTATSTNTPIQYYLGSGRPRSSGTFSNLYPGTYTITARDAAGCRVSWTNIEVRVGISPSANYGVLQRWSYLDFHGNSWRVDLKQRDYTGSITPRNHLDAIPTMRSIRAENQTRLVNILPGELQVNAITETNKEYLELFKDSDEEDFMIEQLVDTGSGFNLIWRGFAVTSLYSEPNDKNNNYVSTITATDRLIDLKQKDFLDEGGNQVYGDISIFEVIRLCLNRTNLSFGYRVAMSLYEAGMDKGASDDPLKQTFIDPDFYYPDGEIRSCYDVLSDVLKSIFCHVFSYGGYWYIMYKPDISDTFAYREFDVNGDYVSNSTINPVIDFKAETLSNRAVWLRGIGLEGTEVYKNININLIRNIKGSILPEFTERNIDGDSFLGWSKVLNGDSGSIIPQKIGELVVLKSNRNENISFSFSGRVKIRGGGRFRGKINEPERSVLKVNKWFYKFSFRDNQGGNAYIVRSGNIEYKGSDSFLLNIPVLFKIEGGGPPYVKLKYRFRVGTKYLQPDGSWSTDATVNEYYIETFNQEVGVDLSGKFDVTVTENTTTTYELRIYDIDPYEYDLQAANILIIASSLPNPDDYDIGTRYVTRFTDSGSYIYWVVVISEDDGSKMWTRLANAALPDPDSRSIIGNNYSTPYIGTIEFETQPDEEPIEDIETIAITTSKNNAIDLPYDMAHFDVNQNVNNLENLINNYFRLQDGTPTGNWGFSTAIISLTGITGTFQVGETVVNNVGAELEGTVTDFSSPLLTIDVVFVGSSIPLNIIGQTSGATATISNVDLSGKTIQRVIGEKIARYYNGMRYKLKGAFRSDVLINGYSVFRDSADENRIYMPVFLGINDRKGEVTAELIEVDSDVTEDASAFTSGFKQNAFT